MDPTFFFLFFLAGFCSLVLGISKRNVGFTAMGGMCLIILFIPLVLEGFTTTQIYQKNLTTTYSYYPLYTAGNQTINMTQNMTNSQTYGYQTVSVKTGYTDFLAFILLGLGLLGLFGSVLLFSGKV